MRGSNTLFSDIFEDNKPPKQRKGRSLNLINKRNECLIARYFYYGKFCDKKYTSIIEILSEEFFLSTVTIPEIIDDNSQLLHSLKKEANNPNHFKNKWPHLTWPAPAKKLYQNVL